LKTWNEGSAGEADTAQLKSAGIIQIPANGVILRDIVSAYGLEKHLHENFREVNGKTVYAGAKDYDDNDTLEFALVDKGCGRFDCSACYSSAELKTKRGI
jgi:hypothetical protein